MEQESCSLKEKIEWLEKDLFFEQPQDFLKKIACTDKIPATESVAFAEWPSASMRLVTAPSIESRL
ncbi:hypothetical protein CBM2633_B90175 [Cupriavidus taiwanensis]|uniref:hypothetical protein n=1 Tax=Cupriavidus taiwanensis TaxID=164546 RepID=UPI000E17EBF2|nr:hypothetical protein [Cupriavidus taiwanensis]SPA22884.1 hypothetical protein CBM2633_B90175 [Cupriavidus taiwanensis]